MRYRYRGPAGVREKIVREAVVVICSNGIAWRLYPCKLWTRALVDGYGKVWTGGQHQLVHRLALAQKLRRPIRPGWRALHHCDVRNCYEPEHLYEGTPSDNMHDAYDRDRRGQFSQTERAAIRLRVTAGMTQTALAGELGVAVSTINRIVNSRR